MFWIGLHFPYLPLETLLRGHDSSQWRDRLWAVIENRSTLACNAAAEASGVTPGMSLAAARVIAPALRTVSRNRRAEQETLEGIAAWLGRFTPRVSLEAPQQLAAEMSGSLRLFGGLRQLEQRLRTGLEALGFTVQLAVAPTARAALWRSAGGGVELDALPVEVTGADPEILRLLRNLGVGTLGELLQLPRDGAARRLGQGLIDDLDRALGRIPDPRAAFVPPSRFAARLELPAQVAEAAGVLFAARRLLVQLEGALAARQSGIRRFVLLLAHSGASTTRLAIPFSRASRDAAHFAALLREHLSRLELAAPVESICLEAAGFEPLHASTAGLFHDARDAGEGWTRLLERLAARLGEEAIQGLAIQAEHRPELASRAVALVCLQGSGAQSSAADPAAGQRPLWLLETPRRLAEDEFVLLTGPERIESGGWNGGEVRRDYFIARTGGSSLVWVFRDRERGWFLHGIFA